MSNHETANPLPADTILNNDYKILKVIGRGGFAITYQATKLSTNQTVAMKEIPFKENTLRIFKEAELLKNIGNLKGIVSINDIFTLESKVYFSMEYIQGITLQDYILQDGTMSFSEIMDLFMPILQSLTIIHNKGIIHRDISPDNLIIDREHQMHLIDFGAATTNSVPKNMVTVILKPGYAPPEQYISSSDLGPWTDIYAVCATIYYALTGNPPEDALKRLDSSSLFPDILQQLQDEKQLSSNQIHGLWKGLSLRPSDRYSNIEILLADFSHQQNNNTIKGQKLTKAQRNRINHLRHKSRNSMLLIVSGVLAILVVLIMISSYCLKLTPNFGGQSDTIPPKKMQGTASMIPSPSSGETDVKDTIKPESSEGLLRMPNFKGKPFTTVKSQLKELDSEIKIKKIYSYHKLIKKDNIISQSISEDTVFSKGNIPSILLIISKGKQKTSSTSSKIDESKKTTKNSQKNYQVKPKKNTHKTIHLD